MGQRNSAEALQTGRRRWVHVAQECQTHRPRGTSAPPVPDLGNPSRLRSPVLPGNSRQPLPLLPRKTPFLVTYTLTPPCSQAPPPPPPCSLTTLLCSSNAPTTVQTHANAALSAPGHSRHLPVLPSSLILHTLKPQTVRQLRGDGHELGLPGFKSWLCPYQE